MLHRVWTNQLECNREKECNPFLIFIVGHQIEVLNESLLIDKSVVMQLFLYVWQYRITEKSVFTKSSSMRYCLTPACCFRCDLQEALQEESQRRTLEVSELRQNVDRLQAQVEKDAVVLQQKAQVNVYLADYKRHFIKVSKLVFQEQFFFIQRSRIWSIRGLNMWLHKSYVCLCSLRMKETWGNFAVRWRKIWKRHTNTEQRIVYVPTDVMLTIYLK